MVRYDLHDPRWPDPSGCGTAEALPALGQPPPDGVVDTLHLCMVLLALLFADPAEVTMSRKVIFLQAALMHKILSL